MVVGEATLATVVNLVVMVLVERSHGQWALGVYSYLFSFYHLVAHVAQWGVPRYLERETALNESTPSRQAQALMEAFQLVLLMGMATGIACALSAPFDTSFTRIQEKMAAYFIIGTAVPVRSLNKLRMAGLHGLGRHRDVAVIEGKKHLLFLGTVAALLAWDAPPSYLTLGFLASELYCMTAGRKTLKLPSFRSGWTGSPERLRRTFDEGGRYLFCDDALTVILYVDLLILGIFLSAWDLG
ncbi:MAG: oligosaccharide flippase family protein, partial [Syntrophobacteraceae bacterium]|nr:oligosaccharide flippase family protein [Syntrophobacteraceae bacterium]